MLLSRSNNLLPLQLAMAVKGFARAGYQPPTEFMRQVAQLAMQKLHQFSPIEYAQLLWAYGELGYRDVALFESVVAHTVHLLQTWTRRLPKTTVDVIVWSCLRVGFWPQMLVDTAEMRGVIVRMPSEANRAEMEPLLHSHAAGSSSGESSGSAEAAAAADLAAEGNSNSAKNSSRSGGGHDSSGGSSGDSSSRNSTSADVGALLGSVVFLGDAEQENPAAAAAAAAALGGSWQQDQQWQQPEPQQPAPQASGLAQQQQIHQPLWQLKQQPQLQCQQVHSSLPHTQQQLVSLQLMQPPRWAAQQQQQQQHLPVAAPSAPWPAAGGAVLRPAGLGWHVGSSSSGSSSVLNGHRPTLHSKQ